MPISCDQLIVVLGASNVTLAWPRLVDLLHARFSGETFLYNAHGMGRSYLYKRSSFGIRQLPGILHCRLWDELPTISSTTPTYAIITDLGNDLLYGSEVGRVAWSALECVKRLREWSPDVDIVVARPPVASVEKLGEMRFHLASRLLFPATRLQLEPTKEATRELADQIEIAANSEAIQTFTPEAAWYGVDPIHVRRRFQRDAFGGMMKLWRSPPENIDAKLVDRRTDRAPRLVRKRPKASVRWILRREIETIQPAANAGRLTVYSY